MGSPRRRWSAARRHLTPVADGGALIVGTPQVTFRTAPLPEGVPVKLWEDCECTYRPPMIDGKPAPRRLDPAWTQWTEDPPREAGRAAGKQCLRYALSDQRTKSDGGLLGPNFYALGHFHSGDARREQPGFPDLLIWTPLGRPNEVWELKTMGENPTLPQAHHLTALELAGFRCRVVRPCCLLAGDVDRWLTELSGREPATPSPWAAGDPEPRAAGPGAPPTPRSLTTTAAPAGAPGRKRRLAVVAEAPPGEPVNPAEPGRAAGYLIPMPGDGTGHLVGQLEGWLRAHGFPPYSVPWPMRIVVGERLLVVWANTGAPGTPGQPRPRAWRSSYLESPFPEHVVPALTGDSVYAPSMSAAMSFVEAAVPMATLPLHLPEET